MLASVNHIRLLKINETTTHFSEISRFKLRLPAPRSYVALVFASVAAGILLARSLGDVSLFLAVVTPGAADAAVLHLHVPSWFEFRPSVHVAWRTWSPVTHFC